jgi:hypothetical protein
MTDELQRIWKEGTFDWSGNKAQTTSVGISGVPVLYAQV